MRFFKKFDGIFTVNGVKYSNAVLRLSDIEMYHFLSEKAGPDGLTVDGVKIAPYDWKLTPQQKAQRKAVLHRLMPNDTEYWEHAVMLFYDLHVSVDGSERICYHEVGDRSDGYVGYLCDTRYADGGESGTYWNQHVIVPAKTREEAIEMFEKMRG